jgi:hypothetical protein
MGGNPLSALSIQTVDVRKTTPQNHDMWVQYVDHAGKSFAEAFKQIFERKLCSCILVSSVGNDLLG